MNFTEPKDFVVTLDSTPPWEVCFPSWWGWGSEAQEVFPPGGTTSVPIEQKAKVSSWIDCASEQVSMGTEEPR